MEMSQAAIKNDDTDIKCFMVVKLSDNKVYLKHTTDQTDQTDPTDLNAPNYHT